MRHGKKFNHLSRKAAHRKALLSNLAISLITHKRIITTLAKAKALRRFVEPIVTKSKVDSMHHRREVFRLLQNKYAVKELFSEVSEKILERDGGYLRIIRIGVRKGDNSEMAIIEFVDFNEHYSVKETKAKRTRKRSRKRPAKTAENQGDIENSTAEEVIATPVEEEVSSSEEDGKKEEKPKVVKEEKKVETKKEENKAESKEIKTPEPKAKKEPTKQEEKEDEEKKETK